MGKKQSQTQIELTNDKTDKDPHRKKQQKAIADKTFKIRKLPELINLAEKQATKLALKIANVQTENLK